VTISLTSMGNLFHKLLPFNSIDPFPLSVLIIYVCKSSFCLVGGESVPIVLPCVAAVVSALRGECWYCRL